MSGITELSNESSKKNSKEVEISLTDVDEQIPTIPITRKIEPEYYECDGDYGVFDSPSD